MGRRVRIVRIGIAAGLALAGLAFAAAPAQAIFHFMKIREVHEGGGAEADYVELQMYAGGQNFVSGHYLVAYDGAGNQFGMPYQFPSDAGNGENQRTILVADSSPIGVTPDFVIPGTNFLVGTGGSVCFIDMLPSTGIDCVSWGSGTMPPTTNPSPVGTPAAPMSAGESLERTIAPNCLTLLEDADDTNDSATDFALATPSPRSNATPPTETACAGGGANPGGGPDTKIDKGPKKKTRKKKARFEFSSTTPGATFDCNVDDKGFQPCTSPFTVKVKKGKHTFEVRAVAGGVPDGSPAEHKWKVKKPRR
jgi:hypothetical protein